MNEPSKATGAPAPEDVNEGVAQAAAGTPADHAKVDVEGQGDAGTGEASADRAPANEQAATVAELTRQLEEVRRALAEAGDQQLRTLADMDNLRKRTRAEVEKAQKFAVERFAGELLNVADTFERALQHAPEPGADDSRLKAFLEGITATQRQLMGAFEKFEVVRVPALGERLDPNRHEAVQQVADPSLPDGTITTVYQQGYEIAGRLLRPAMVVVATGGPSRPRGEAATNGDAGPNGDTGEPAAGTS
ncbi:MAG: nucleotide exchange factor GrpE [Rhizobiales bacterium]|nr:nucleotide exchange factor GrpE [Hyphomicrobiales bacterium]